MNSGQCKNEQCNAAITRKCHLGSDMLSQCPNWNGGQETTTKGAPKTALTRKPEAIWNGEDLKIEDIEQVSRRSSPLIIGLVGPANAAKTSFLGAFYLQLKHGQRLANFKFAGSRTLLRWEHLANKLVFEKGNVSFPAPTPSNADYYSFLHLTFREEKKRLVDVLLADISGEVYVNWTTDKNDPSAENVRWVDSRADGYIFFVNSETVRDKRMAAVHDVLDMAARLNEGLRNRPIVCVWSKADCISEVHPNHLDAINKGLEQLFGVTQVYEISNYLDVTSTPDPKSLNNLSLLDDLLMLIMSATSLNAPSPNPLNVSDRFLAYRGKI